MRETISVESDGPKLIVNLPDIGEDHAEVEIRLPSGDKLMVGYSGLHGTVDVSIYEPAEGKRGEMFGGWASKECIVTNWIDEKDEDGVYKSSMHSAPSINDRAHERLATQLVIHIHESKDSNET